MAAAASPAACVSLAGLSGGPEDAAAPALEGGKDAGVESGQHRDDASVKDAARDSASADRSVGDGPHNPLQDGGRDAPNVAVDGGDSGARKGDAGDGAASHDEAGCPSGRGPNMVEVGGLFCIDSTEVTNAQYEQFLASNPDLSTQSAVCDWNTSFTPSTSWPYPVGNEDYPVVFVDWCDADAFCKWANKRICGAIDGGTLAFSDYANAGADQHYYACSHDGTLAYPYGNTWSPTTCNGANAGHGELLPVASLSGCNGGFPGVFDLVGNAEEWQDSCNGTTGATDNCLDGPESYAFPSADAGAAGARCDFLDDDLRSSHLPDVGIRCCSP